MNGELLREGIYALNTRRFGTVAEVLVKRLVSLDKARSQFHDLYDDIEQKRVEVKFSRALRKNELRITEDTVLRCIESARSEYRLVAYDDRETTEFDCNIQQIKRAEFDVLYYGIFFKDYVEIFRIESSAIEHAAIGYSDRQHKGNVGEGQFHISQETISIHEKHYLFKRLTYQDFYEVLA